MRKGKKGRSNKEGEIAQKKRKERRLREEGKRGFNSQSQGPNSRFSFCGTLRQRIIGGKKEKIDLILKRKEDEGINEG